MRGAGRHHLERAAREAERRGEHRVAAAPAHEVLEPAGQEVVRDLVERHQAASPGCGIGASSAGSSGPGRRVEHRAARSAAPAREPLERRRAPGAHSSAPTDSRYANGTSSTSTNTAIAIEPEQTEPAEHRDERIEEHDLDVEHDEAHRDQIELHREALGRLAPSGTMPHSYGACFAALPPLGCEQLRRDEREQHERDDEDGHHEDRQVVAHASHSWRLRRAPRAGTARRLSEPPRDQQAVAPIGNRARTSVRRR